MRRCPASRISLSPPPPTHPPQAGAQLCARAWGGGGRLHAPAFSAPFLAVVETPLDLRAWLQPPLPPDATPEAVEAAYFGAAAAVNERMSNALLAQSRIQGVFWAWRTEATGLRVYVRLSAQVRQQQQWGRLLTVNLVGLPLHTAVSPRRSTTSSQTTWRCATESSRLHAGAGLPLDGLLRRCDAAGSQATRIASQCPASPGSTCGQRIVHFELPVM